MLETGQALASGTSAQAAASDAARGALERAGGGKPDLALVFFTEHYEAAAVSEAVRAVVGNVPVAGAQVPGVLAEGRVAHDGVGVLVLTGGAVAARTGLGEGVHSQGARAGERAVARALDRLEGIRGVPAYDRSALLVMPDAIQGNPCDVLRGVDAGVGSSIRLIGGGAGDGLRFRETWQLAGEEVATDAVLAVALAADGPIGVALRHGCAPWGPPMKVTRSAGRTLHELDWRAARDQYLETVYSLDGQRLSESELLTFAMLHPFGIPQGGEDYVLRSPLAVGDVGEIRCCADLPVDGIVRVMQGDVSSLLTATREAGAVAAGQLRGRRPGLALVFSCVSRDVVHSTENPSLEIDAVRDGVGLDVPVFGALTFGQLGALRSGAPHFHSKSVQVCVLPV